MIKILAAFALVLVACGGEVLTEGGEVQAQSLVTGTCLVFASDRGAPFETGYCDGGSKGVFGLSSDCTYRHAPIGRVLFKAYGYYVDQQPCSYDNGL